MKFERRHTNAAIDPLDAVTYVQRNTIITGKDGTEIFRLDDFDVPENWSQLATDIVASKYFRKRGVPKTGHETTVRQVIHRLAHTIRRAGEDAGGYFDSTDDADTFESELAHHLVNQMGAFNSPVWFNCGLYHEYNIRKGNGGHYHWDNLRERVLQTKDAYSHPQCSACYIQSVEDDLMAIFDLLKSEARLFKYGSGTGTNFSPIRGNMEKLSGGGTSSGLMSFLEVFDKGAGATKSGGITRRAAKMVTLDIDHPEIVDFINWKANEEKKVAALIEGGYSSDFNGEAYRTVSGQNSNNSVRIPDTFMETYENDGEWQTTLRATRDVWKTYKARDLMRQIADAAWGCADPGTQYDTTINTWHTCPNTGRINGSNPCSEYMFLDDSACNLSSINLMKFLNDDGTFDVDGFRHACRLFFVAQEILIDFASYPTKRIAQNSHDYRPLGLGYANLGTLLMVMGLPYDSPEGTAICGAVTAIMCGEAYKASAKMAKDKSPFPGFEKNREPMLNVMRMHRDAAYAIDDAHVPAYLAEAARTTWDDAVKLGKRHGYRNAQATVLAPTGTIGLLMDCDTTGVEPDFALVKFKKLAGGGYFKIVNTSVPVALARLGYSKKQQHDIVAYIVGTFKLEGTPNINAHTLREKGFSDADIEKVEDALPGAFDLSFAVNPWILGDETMERLGFIADKFKSPGFNLLQELGFTPIEIDAANDIICGKQTIEGAPHLHEEHLPVFDCANTCGKSGKRFIRPLAHLNMMSAAQKFISGAISKTVNVPHETSSEQIEDLYVEGWKLGLKAVAMYRDGSKLSQPLTSSSKSEKTATEDTEKTEGASAEAVEAGVEAEVVSRTEVDPAEIQAAISKAVDEALAEAQREKAPIRRRLPSKRKGFTQEARVAGHKVFLRTGEYEDGSLGEIFIDMHKEGAPFRSMLNVFAIAISKGLQFGVPLDDLVETFTFTRFEPAGMVDHPNIRFATSVIDYVFRVLGYEYLGRTDFLQVKPEEISSDLAIEEETERESEVAERETGGTGERETKSDSAGATEDVSPAPPLSRSPKSTTTNPQVKADSDHPDTEAQATLQSPTVVDVSQKTNGNGANGHRTESIQPHVDVLDQQMSQLQGDAPFCDVCGHITIRNGACYKCLNCGNSMGCS